MTRTASIGIRVEPELKEAVEKAAKDDGRTVAQWMERASIKVLQDGGYLPKPPGAQREPTRRRPPAAPGEPSSEQELTKLPLPDAPEWEHVDPQIPAAFNTDIPRRLKLQLDYVVEQTGKRKITLRKATEDALRAYVQARGLPG